MLARSVTHDTFVIERSYPVSPEEVFAAFSDAAKKRRWFAEGEGHDLEAFETDFRVDGAERARFRIRKGGPFEGTELTTDARFQDIVPNARIVMSSTMTFGGRRISAALATFELIPSDSGTVLVLTHQAAFFEGADGPERRQAGWQKLLDQLGRELGR